VVESLVGVLGARSLVGECLLPLLNNAELRVVAFSRRALSNTNQVQWCQLPCTDTQTEIRDWICVAPIWVLPDYFNMMEACGARRIVVLSSTSRFTKAESGDAAEHAVVAKLIDGETRLQVWAQSRGIEWVILRPTLIYGLGRDKNITEIARFIRRFGVFPLFGKANGLRQPIHAADVAIACLSALQSPLAANHAYNISGGQVLTYREMVLRIFAALGRRPYVLTIPLWGFRLAVSVLRRVPRYRQWSSAMAERMNQDLVFDQTEPMRDLNFNPRAFQLMPEDLPR